MDKHLDLYTRLGMNVIPLRPRDKRPSLSSWATYQQRMSTEDERSMWWFGHDLPEPHNIGVVTGAISRNLIVLDFDDAIAYDRACDSIPWLADTLHVSTGRGHHVYLNSVSDPGATMSMTLDGAAGKHHIKANGGYVVAPPSIHPSGAHYKWDNLYDWELDEPLLIELADLVPALMAAGFKRSAPEAREIPVGFWDDFVSSTHSEGGRADALVKLVGILRKGIGSQAIAYELALGWNQRHLVPPLPDAEVRGTVRSYYSRYRGPTDY